MRVPPSGAAPLAAPLTYPGIPPPASSLVTSGQLLTLRPTSRRPVEEWPVGALPDSSTDGGSATESLRQALAARRVAPLGSRHPVVAVGSNASPAQLRRKLRDRETSVIVPLTRARVADMVVGHSAHVSRPGYIPAAPVGRSHARAEVWICWLDDDQRGVIDATEGGYEAHLLDPARHPVVLESGEQVTTAHIYVSRHGVLQDEGGRPEALTDQQTLISRLLADVPHLEGAAGPDVDSWLRALPASADRRVLVRRILKESGRVRAANLSTRPAPPAP